MLILINSRNNINKIYFIYSTKLSFFIKKVDITVQKILLNNF